MYNNILYSLKNNHLEYISLCTFYDFTHISKCSFFSTTFILQIFFSVNVSLSMSDKPVSRWATPVGSCTAWNMESNLTVRCHLTKLSEVAMTHSTLSSVKLVLESTSQELCSLIWNLPSLVRYLNSLFVNSRVK